MNQKLLRRLSLVLALILVLGLTAGFAPVTAQEVWNGQSAASFAGGSGTRSDPYLIATPGQLARFRDMVNDGSTGICGKVVADLDMNFISWEPIGLTSTGYTGIFDGGGWSIKNLYIDTVSNTLTIRQSNGNTYKTQVAGLFGVVGESGSVKYVNVSGTVTGNIYARNNTSIYIGALAGTNFGTIEECFSTCAISGLTIDNHNYIGIGGLVGNAYGDAVIKNCYNVGQISATLKLTKTSLNNYIGGLAGLADCQMYNCYSATSISISTNSSKLYQGGVVGNAGGNFLSNCHFDRQVCTATSYVAGTRYSPSGPFNPAGCEALYSVSMQNDMGFVYKLGSAFAYDYNGVNSGYPVLAVMTYGEDSDWSEWYEDEVGGTVIDMEIYERLFPAELMNKDLTRDITRAEFAAVAVKLYEEMGGQVLDPATLTNPFTDTSSDAVIKAYALGITVGVSATEFSPYTVISRQDLVTMLTRVYKKLNFPNWSMATDSQYTLDYSGVTPFADDAFISDYARPSVYFMVKNNVIKGISETLFAPRNTTSAEEAIGYANASREQAMIIAIRMFKNL